MKIYYVELTEDQVLDLELVISKMHSTFDDDQGLQESMRKIETKLTDARNK